MQDIHSLGSGGGRLLGGGDRRLRPHNHQNHQALKCPRCESLNTKFCYYNNYNLSQPRHFCKSCRRYWTKGGVLRNVPVGGGCRKTKRSKSKPSSEAQPQREQKSNSHSSSESSNLTAAATTATAATEVVSGSSSNSASTLLNFSDSRFFNFPQTTNPSFDLPLIDQSSEAGMFPEIGPFTSLMTSANDPSLLGFNIADISNSTYRMHHQNHAEVLENQGSNQMADQLKMQDITAGFLEQTPHTEFTGLENRTIDGGLAGVDWQAGGDQGLFDLTGTVDHSYWTQTQWTDNDHPLNYLP